MFIFHSKKKTVVFLSVVFVLLLSTFFIMDGKHPSNVIQQEVSNLYNGSSEDVNVSVCDSSEEDSGTDSGITAKNILDSTDIIEADTEEEPLLTASHGVILTEHYPNISTYQDGNSWGFPMYLPSDWRVGQLVAKAGFAYSNIQTGGGGTFVSATAVIQTFNTASNIDVSPYYVNEAIGKQVTFTKCLTGSSDSAPATVDDSNHGPYPLDSDNGALGNPILRFYVQAIDEANRRVYLRIQTPYIAYDSRKTSVQAVAGGVYFDYNIPQKEPEESYITIRKYGFTSNADNNWTLYGFSGIRYGVYLKSDNRLVGTFTLDDDGKPTPESLKVEADTDYYLKEISSTQDNKYYKVSETQYPFHSGKAQECTQVSPMLIKVCDEIRFGQFYGKKESADASLTGKSDLYDISGAKYHMYDAGGKSAQIIVGFADENVSGTNLSYKKPILRKVNHFTTDENGYFTFQFTYDGDKTNITSFYSKVQKAGNVYTITFTEKSPMLLPIGKYSISEYSPSKGHLTDKACDEQRGKSHTVSIVNTSSIETMNCTEPISVCDMDLEILKKSVRDKQTPLSGAVFEISYYEGFYQREALASQTAKRNWYFATDENGAIHFKTDKSYSDKEHVTSKFYRDDSGNRCIPVGTVTVKEVIAPDGYQLISEAPEQSLIAIEGTECPNQSEFVFFIRQNDQNKCVLQMEDNSEITLNDTVHMEFYNTERRTDISIHKKSYPDNKDMPSISFKLTSKTTGEEHILVTDEKGYATTKDNPDMWFYGTSDKTKWDSSSIDIKSGALPADTYILKELPSAGNNRYQLVSEQEIVIPSPDDEGELVYDLFNVPLPILNTKARDSESDSTSSIPKNGCNIQDTVSYQYLKHDTNYIVKGILVARTDCISATGVKYKKGTPIRDDNGNCITSSVAFTTDKAEDNSQIANAGGDVILSYSFDAKTLSGIKGVFNTYLCEGDNDRPLIVTENRVDEKENKVIGFPDTVDSTIHYVEDLNPDNRNEWVNFAAMETDAWTSTFLTNIGAAGTNTNITDTVVLEGLEEGREYSLTATLINPENQEALCDDNKEPLVSEKTFIYKENEEQQMKVNVRLPQFDSSKYRGGRIVVFEELKCNGTTLLNACDIDDVRESIYFPNLQTTATGQNGSKNMAGVDNIVIHDKVKYSGLAPDKDYMLSATLHYIDEKGQKQTLKKKDGTIVSAAKIFTTNDTDGEIMVDFTFSAKEIGEINWKSLVVFEELYHDNLLIGSHADINDNGQTIYLPSIGTKLCDKKTKSKTLPNHKDTITLTDTVSYHNLIIGEQYFIIGKIINKETGKTLICNGTELQSTKTFCPQKSDGSVAIIFEFDGLTAQDLTEDSHLVAYEYLYSTHDNKNVLIAAHTDIEDANQTVTFQKKEVKEKKKTEPPKKVVEGAVKTGDTLYRSIIAVILCAVVLFEILLVIKNRKKKGE